MGRKEYGGGSERHPRELPRKPDDSGVHADRRSVHDRALPGHGLLGGPGCGKPRVRSPDRRAPDAPRRGAVHRYGAVHPDPPVADAGRSARSRACQPRPRRRACPRAALHFLRRPGGPGLALLRALQRGADAFVPELLQDRTKWLVGLSVLRHGAWGARLASRARAHHGPSHRLEQTIHNPGMRFGRFEVHLFSAGVFKQDGGLMFGVVPKVVWERVLKADERNRVTVPMNCLLVSDDRNVVLLETGAGDKLAAKWQDIWGIDPRE